MKYYKSYQNLEIKAFEKFVRETNLKKHIKKIERNNTAFHDLRFTTFKDKTYTVEVKKDELYWYEKTNNIGIDYISAFKTSENSKKYVYRNWVKKTNLKMFIDTIEVYKWGKLFTCDSNFQFFYVVDDSGDFVLSKLYSNQKMQKYLRPYLEENYDLRINNKYAYASREDTWESAAYFVNPTDEALINCELKVSKE